MALSTTKATVLTAHTDGVAIEVKKSNQYTMAHLTMVMETPEMLNMISLEKKQDTDQPSGKFPSIYKLIKEGFAPDDVVVELDMEDDLQKSNTSSHVIQRKH